LAVAAAVPKQARGPLGRRRAAAVRAAATKALASMLQPLAGFVLDSGLSVRELEGLFRTAAVLTVAQRQRASQNRVNISGIAAATGIPRAEISQILRAPKRQTQAKLSTQTPINRILAAWHEEPGYQKPNGKPAELKLFGAHPSFECLVKKHGGGLPARAILDELVRVGAASVLDTEKALAKSFAAIGSQLSPRAIHVFAEEALHLFSVLSAVENSQGHNFLSVISAAHIDRSQLPLFRREVAARAADFLSTMRDNLTIDEDTQNSSGPCRQLVNLAVIYNEGVLVGVSRRSSQLRRNFRRAPQLRRL